MKDQTWGYLDTGSSDALTNMAIDEVLLKKMGRGKAAPILRLYTWSLPAITVGYFQNVRRDFDLDLCRRRGWALVRRLTGGRAVFHDHELTYSIHLPLSFAGAMRSVLASYQYLGQGLVQGLRELGMDAELVSLHGRKTRRPGDRSPDCFASPSWYEISVEGKKLVGSAQRRMPYGILQQGSILISTRRFHEFYEVFPQLSDKNRKSENHEVTDGLTSLTATLEREVPLGEVKASILQGFRKVHGIRFLEQTLTSDDQKTANELVTGRYGRSDWNLYRKPPVFKGKC